MRETVFYIDNGADLNYLKKEFRVIDDSHTVVAALRGEEATYEKIFDKASQKDATILHVSGHFMAHKNGYGFKIADTVLTDQHVLKVAQAINAQAVYLNGCGTSLIGGWLKKKGVKAVISNSRLPEIDDREAWSNSITFYRELANNGLNIKLAYDVIADEYTDWDNGSTVETVIERIDSLSGASKYQCWMITIVMLIVLLLCVSQYVLAIRIAGL